MIFSPLRSTTTGRSARGAAAAQRPGIVLDSWIDHCWDTGVQIEQLDALQHLRVRTRNSVYELVVLDSSGNVRVRGGRYAGWIAARLTGSSAGGHVLKQLGIHVGLRLELEIDGRRLITSPIESVTVLPDSSVRC